ncbi:MAG: class II aldolase/adducin family protein [Steroidobacteraceae bacterium]
MRNAALGQEFAQHLGTAAVALMRGHGFTAVGSSVPQAVFRAVYTSRNSEIQQAALLLGGPKYLSDEEAIACEKTITGQAD